MAGAESFYQVITAAVADVSDRGYVSPDQIAEWARRIREAAKRSMTPEHVLDDALRQTLGKAYERLIDRDQILRYHQGLTRFDIARVKPRLRAELDRRILASASLIKLNRVAATEKTIQRFAGWSTSIPKGGSDVVDKLRIKSEVRKAMASLPFEERRVIIDQSAKFSNELSAIIAKDQNALAAEWNHHHVTYPRKEHLARNGKVFLVRDSWAHDRGLVKVLPNGYTDEIEQPGELVFCRCSYRWIYNLRDVPLMCLTEKGRQALRAAA
jgi:hypothetical protein